MSSPINRFVLFHKINSLPFNSRALFFATRPKGDSGVEFLLVDIGLTSICFDVEGVLQSPPVFIRILGFTISSSVTFVLV